MRILGLTAPDLVEIVELFPPNVAADYRQRRPYLSALLAKNEIEAPGGRSRHLFQRRRHGIYYFNPGLAVWTQPIGGDGTWTPVTELLNEPLRVMGARMFLGEADIWDNATSGEPT
ncbi:MAG: hypothetical protein ABIP94_11285 [Planctomycetota bacterium]